MQIATIKRRRFIKWRTGVMMLTCLVLIGPAGTSAQAQLHDPDEAMRILSGTAARSRADAMRNSQGYRPNPEEPRQGEPLILRDWDQELYDDMQEVRRNRDRIRKCWSLEGDSGHTAMTKRIMRKGLGC